MLDEDKNGTISVEELRKGLAKQSLYGIQVSFGVLFVHDSIYKILVRFGRFFVSDLCFGMQSGRYYVIMSLKEAQDLRSCIHIVNQGASTSGGLGHELFKPIAGKTTSLGIRLLPSGILLDCTTNFDSPAEYVKPF